MLSRTADYDLAARAGVSGEDSVKAAARAMLYREYNAILSPTVTVTPDPIDPRFGGENVLKSRNPQGRGISFGPLDEYYLSEDPISSYRFIHNVDYDEDRTLAYYIPEDTASTALAEVIIDYGAAYDMNSIEARYDQTRTVGSVYDYDLEFYTATTLGSWTQVWSGSTDDSGKTQVYYNGTDWNFGRARVNDNKVSARYVRLVVRKNSDNVNPRVIYFGGQDVIKLNEDIIDLSVDKSEFEQSSYLPYGEPSSNSCSISLDNTDQQYRYGPAVSEDYFQKYQKVTVEFGFDVTKYGASLGYPVEFIPAGTYYIEDFEYDEEDMMVSVNATDYSIFLKERMCENALWENRSVKYIIKDVLARAGFSPRFCTFNFGVTGNADESNKRNYVWSHDEQTVWDFLSTFIKSELGAMYFDEEENLVFTDREYFRTSISNGSVLSLTAENDIEGMSERYVIDTNKVNVRFSDIGPSSTKFNPAAVAGPDGTIKYVNQGERFKNDILWSPSDDTFLGSSVLQRPLTPSSTQIILPVADAAQISEDEGIVRIGRELIKYNNRIVDSNYLRLVIEERGAYNTPINGNLPRYLDPPTYRIETAADRTMPNVSAYRHLFRPTKEGLRARKLYKSQWGIGKWTKYFIRPEDMNYSTNYDVYGMSFRFNKIPSGYKDDQAAGLFINNTHLDRAWYFEVNKYGINKGTQNMLAYKGGIYMDSNVRMPPFPDSHTADKRILFEESGVDPDTNQFRVGTPINIMVYNDKAQKRLFWYVNGNLVDSSDYTYSKTEPGIFEDLKFNQEMILEYAANRGEFGFFTHGSTDITVDYMFATNQDQFNGYEILRPYDPSNGSFNRDYLPEAFVGYYEEFGEIVHEAAEYEAEHSIYPSMNPMILNTLEHKLHVHYQTHTPFTSRIIVSNNDRWGVNINGTNFSPDGSQITTGFLVYGVPIVTNEDDTVEVSDKEGIRKYGPSEVEITNDWVDSRKLAKSIGNSIKAQWSQPVSIFQIDWFPNPALQPGDRITVSHTDKGFQTSDIWIVTGIDISFDGGLSSTITAKRFLSTPPAP